MGSEKRRDGIRREGRMRGHDKKEVKSKDSREWRRGERKERWWRGKKKKEERGEEMENILEY